MKKILTWLVVGIAIGIIIMQLISYARIVKLESQDVLYTIQIKTDYINVRNQPTTQAKIAYEVVKGEKYEVIEVFDEDPNYIWYKIIYSDKRTGWIASSITDSWVEEVK